MKKFVFNLGFISSLMGGFNLAKSSRGLHKDWRLILTWFAWAISLVFTVDGIVQANREKEMARQEKAAKKDLNRLQKTRRGRRK